MNSTVLDRTVVAVLLLVSAACGDDGEEEQEAPTRAAASGSRAPAPTGLFGSGGSLSISDAFSDFPMLTCDTSVENETKCGDTMCPAPTNLLASCTTICCTAEEKCGTRNAAVVGGQTLSSECVESALPDPRCPSSSVAGVMAAGCCDSGNRCGQLAFGTCLSLGNGPPCDAARASSSPNDAGI